MEKKVYGTTNGILLQNTQTYALHFPTPPEPRCIFAAEVGSFPQIFKQFFITLVAQGGGGGGGGRGRACGGGQELLRALAEPGNARGGGLVCLFPRPRELQLPGNRNAQD